VSDYVADASVAVKWFLAEVHWEAAARVQGPEHRLHTPAFFSLEFGNVLCKKIRRGEISSQDAGTILDKLQRVNIRRHQDECLLGPAFQLAIETPQPVRLSLPYPCLAPSHAVSHSGPPPLRCSNRNSVCLARSLGRGRTLKSASPDTLHGCILPGLHVMPQPMQGC
jgi:predicted nucleic acid-binding protein